ncbi:peptidoglycan editing factor PgeF [Fulvivirgaceae bacterium PWU4]|uniref:Purine nucleoside phosphorylase n=1 Tax=Chryseosolibacter histidini TaxID=2782349 RepID=A0AAP2DUE0_9BACT|nr:peptidoglycan editing factor PgeF [Chryseosolibacter histidini]MBT1700814.1 peptidoglycan editing factor PgeF [Chryseosolibacter histidini]
MRKIQLGGLDLWQFENLERETSINHFVSGRSSNRNGKEFTLSYSSSPYREEVQHNRRLLATAMGVDEAHLYFPSQVHKTRIVNVTRNTSKDELMETDALITREKGICIAVMSADCVPILLYDTKNNVAGAVHSGWRGTVARILEKTLLEMKRRFGTEGKDLVAGIGPSVSQESYEVGEEVVNSVTEAFGKENRLMIPQADNKARLDLWEANRILLREFGVDDSRIETSDLCTVKHNQHFFSARKGDAGRFAAGIVLV